MFLNFLINVSNILFSVIVPTYNRESFIVKTIQSVLSQTYLNFELIIVDDGSTDNTEQVVKKIQDKRIKYYKKKNAERGAARNHGTNKEKGGYITFLDSDDLLYSKYLEEANSFIKKIDLKIFFINYLKLKSSLLYYSS